MANKDGCTEERFLKDVAKHEMTIVSDDGVHRHIQFSRPESNCMRFDLITWPGYLCYTGDMGTYVFRRLNDMFGFFRTDREYSESRGRALCINTGYWAEKCEAADRNDGIMKYSHEKFRQAVKEYMANNEFPLSARKAVQDEILSSEYDNEHDAYSAALYFVHGDYRFEDFFEYEMKEYAFRYLWCCYALAWGIKKYDEMKAYDAALGSKEATCK